MKLINIGFGNLISEERLVAVISPDSAPVMDSDHVVLSALPPERFGGRAENAEERERI